MSSTQEPFMPVSLPHPIDEFVHQENRSEGEDLAEAFAANAVVRDEGQTYVGRAAIAQWRAGTRRKYNHSIAPIELADRDGRTVLRALLSGNFPGSPIVLDFAFLLEDGKIASLEIKS